MWLYSTQLQQTVKNQHPAVGLKFILYQWFMAVSALNLKAFRVLRTEAQ